MKTFDFFGFYLGTLLLKPGSPVAHRYEVNELTDECRTSSALFLRLWPLRRALIFGRWQESGMTGPEMFDKVFQARGIDLYDEDGNLHPRFAQQAREVIARSNMDPDQEWTILQAVGLD